MRVVLGERNISFIRVMSPFSIQLKKLRMSRNLTQKEVAEVLGYEQSYLSALENGKKNAPQVAFIHQMEKKLQLNEQEKNQLINSLQRSCRRFLLPVGVSEQEYELFNELKSHWGSLSEAQVNLIKLVLQKSS